MAEPRFGLVPDLGGTKRLVELVGYARAAHICLAGARIDAEEALRVGLAATVVPADQLLDAAEADSGRGARVASGRRGRDQGAAARRR